MEKHDMSVMSFFHISNNNIYNTNNENSFINVILNGGTFNPSYPNRNNNPNRDIINCFNQVALQCKNKQSEYQNLFKNGTPTYTLLRDNSNNNLYFN